MSDEPQPIEEPKLETLEDRTKRMFPEPKRQVFTFHAPPIVVSRDGDNVTVRDKKDVQIEHEIEEWFCFGDDLPQNKDYPIKVQRLSALKFNGAMARVLDEASIPTAADYLSQVGQRTLINFSATEIPSIAPQLSFAYGKPVFHCRRIWVTLP